MTISLPRSAIARLASGALLVAAAVSLAACETAGLGAAGSMAQAATPAPPTEPPNPMAQENTAAASQGPMTHRKAALYCWMSTEHGRADLPLDKRADVVDKCIKRKMAGN